MPCDMFLNVSLNGSTPGYILTERTRKHCKPLGKEGAVSSESVDPAKLSTVQWKTAHPRIFGHYKFVLKDKRDRKTDRQTNKVGLGG